MLRTCCYMTLWVCMSSLPGRAAEPLRQAAPDAPSQIAAAVQKELNATLFPGAVVLIGTPQRVLYHEAFGIAQVTPEQAPMRRDSIFDVASVTKVVCTATAIGICRDRGLVDPDEPLTAYLPDHQGKGAELISLRRLASHTSGFPEGPRVGHGGRFTGDALFARLLKDNPTWPVNTHYQYACRNLILLSTIVERVTGEPFGEFCQREIFEPLEMVDTAFNKVEPSQRVAGSHHPVLGENHNEDVVYAGRPIGNAGLFTTALDLSNFSQMMLQQGQWRGKRLLSAETVADFTTLNQLPQFPGWGFVWEMNASSLHRPTRMSHRAYGHSGHTGISIWIDPELQVFTLVMTNRTHPTKVGKNTPKGQQQYLARGRIADAMLAAFGYEDASP